MSTGRRLHRAAGPLVALVLTGALVSGCGGDGQQAEDLKEARAKVQELTAQDAAADEALAAAKTLLVEITTYSWKEGDHEFDWLDKIAGDELREKLAPNVPDLQKAIVKGKVTAEGQVVDSAARVVDPEQVEVLAFVDQAITDETNKDIKIEEQRVSMTMKLIDDDWLVERLELLSGTNNQSTQ
ncbi:MAG: hypothetical protein NTX33_15315 [Propionibacteriales bacterium]|nr:hypothetical protein [Propionibacteriales bacterium]